MEPQTILRQAHTWMEDEEIGLIEFIVRDGLPSYGAHNYHEVLSVISQWPTPRLRLCLDLTDSSFAILF